MQTLEAGLAEAVRRLFGGRARVVELRRSGGGASVETWIAELQGARVPRLVLRRDSERSRPLASRRTEYEVMVAAWAAGVPVPRPLLYEPAGGLFGRDGFIVEFAEGQTLPRRIQADPRLASARGRLPAQLAAALARIHRVSLETLPSELAIGSADPVTATLNRWQAVLDTSGEAFPVIEAGLRWLRLNPPPVSRSGLVHGDFRLGNLMVDEAGLVAVLDWELAGVGDPAEDIGWLCVKSWRFGGHARVGGIGELDEFLAEYSRRGGHPIQPSDVDYWEVFGNVKWAVICAEQARRHRSGEVRSLELAVLGRRVCEPELDLITLLERIA